MAKSNSYAHYDGEIALKELVFVVLALLWSTLPFS